MEIDGTELIRQHLELERLDERGIEKYIGEQIRTMSLIESKIQSTKDKAKTALQKANDAQGKIRAFHKKDAIEKLQQAALAQSEALEEMVKCNTCIFENQKALSEVSKRLMFLGIGNIARNRLVLKQLREYLAGMDSEDPNSMMRIELSGLVSELNSQLDLMQRVQNISQGLNDVDDSVGLVQTDVEELKKNLEDKDKDLKEMKESLDRMKKAFEEKDKDSKETRKIAEKAMRQAGKVTKKSNVGMWIIGGVIVIAAISLALIFGNFSF